MIFVYKKVDNVSKEIATEDMKIRLSMLWIFAMFNMVFADIVGFLNPETLEEMTAMKLSQGMLLTISILLEIPIAMIVLSRILNETQSKSPGKYHCGCNKIFCYW